MVQTRVFYYSILFAREVFAIIKTVTAVTYFRFWTGVSVFPQKEHRDIERRQSVLVAGRIIMACCTG